MQNKIKSYLLENMEELKQVVGELNSWNGTLENLQVYENDEEFFNTFFHNKPEEAVRASFYGDYRYMDEYVRFNGYANLESLSEYQVEEELKDSIEDIVDTLQSEWHNIYVSSELEELLEALEEE